MIRLYADFNHRDEQGRVLLDTVGSLADVETHASELRDGMRVILHMNEDFEVEGTLLFDGVWVAVPDFATLQDSEPQSGA